MYSPVWNPLLFAVFLGLLVLKQAQCVVALVHGPAGFMVSGRARCVVAKAKGPESFVAPGQARCDARDLEVSVHSAGVICEVSTACRTSFTEHGCLRMALHCVYLASRCFSRRSCPFPPPISPRPRIQTGMERLLAPSRDHSHSPMSV